MVKLTSGVRPKDVPLRMRPLSLHIGPYGDVLRTSRRFSGTSSGRPRDVIFPSGYFFRTATFSEEELFQEQICLEKRHFFLIVLRNQFHSIYTLKGFPLTIIHSFKCSMVRSDFEILQSFIVENSKQRINFNTGCVTNVSFWERQ